MRAGSRSRSRRPRTLPSMSRSPIRTTTPPRIAGSTLGVEYDAAAGQLPRDGSRARRTSSAVSGVALVAVAWVDARCGCRRGGRTPSATRGSCSIRPRRTQRQDEVADRLAQVGERPLPRAPRAAGSSGIAGLASDAHQPSSVSELAAARVELCAATTSIGRRRGPDLEGGVRRSGAARVALRHQRSPAPPSEPPARAGARQGTPRRGAAGGPSLIVPPTHAGDACRARSATSPRSSRDRACFSALDLGASRARAAARARLASPRCPRRARSWATFWARARISFASRRASWSVGEAL